MSIQEGDNAKSDIYQHQALNKKQGGIKTVDSVQYKTEV